MQLNTEYSWFKIEITKTISYNDTIRYKGKLTKNNYIEVDKMPFKLWISREEEVEIPGFTSREEARKYFKEKYEEAFQLSESFKMDGEQVYSYMYIVDREKFNEIQEYMETHNTCFINSEDPKIKGFMESYQSILIFEDRRLSITH
ncbi:hypothetical protein FNE59_14700 [Bacillus thuringiensis]|nr:hypothetical protein [Bacillus thuringiensis]MRC86854.1 hypothetical protein [Bacillus thuringiensis]